MNMLIGITSTHDLKLTVKKFRDAHNLLHSNMQQPAIEATAIVLGVNSHEYTHHIDKRVVQAPWGKTAQEIQEGIANLLHAGNENCLIQHMQTNLEKYASSPLQKLTNGNLVSGISTPAEAEYIRSNNGAVLHIVNAKRQHKHNPLMQPGDFTIFVNSDIDPEDLELFRTGKKIEEHLKQKRLAAQAQQAA
jgi:hypothetical protein